MPETLQACEVVQSATQDELNLAREVCGQNCILCQANSTQNDTPAVERAEVARPVRHTRPREPQIVCDATVIPNTVLRHVKEFSHFAYFVLTGQIHVHKALLFGI
jgi:hypothetical protein